MRNILPMPGKFRKILTKLGYREMKDSVWGKPVAYHIFLIFIDDGVLTFFNHFTGADSNKILLWDRKELDINDLEESIKFTEYSTRINVSCSKSDFSFITKKEMIESFL